MTKEEAANKIISMYSTYTERNGDRYGEMSAAVTLAVAALAESASKDACAECREEHDQLAKLLAEVTAIRSALEAR